MSNAVKASVFEIHEVALKTISYGMRTVMEVRKRYLNANLAVFNSRQTTR